MDCVVCSLAAIGRIGRESSFVTAIQDAVNRKCMCIVPAAEMHIPATRYLSVQNNVPVPAAEHADAEKTVTADNRIKI